MTVMTRNVKRWTVLLGFYSLLVAACASQDSLGSDPATATDDEAVTAAGPEALVRCPLNCNDSGCRLANGTCTIACNACLCKQRGGTPDNHCLTEADVVDDRGDEVADSLAIGGGQCGGKVCGKGTYCCNPSCSTCEPFGASCTQQSCN